MWTVANYLLKCTRWREQNDLHSKANFTVHDLRRTFIATAESLDIPAYALKRQLNHKMN